MACSHAASTTWSAIHCKWDRDSSHAAPATWGIQVVHRTFVASVGWKLDVDWALCAYRELSEPNTADSGGYAPCTPSRNVCVRISRCGIGVIKGNKKRDRHEVRAACGSEWGVSCRGASATTVSGCVGAVRDSCWLIGYWFVTNVRHYRRVARWHSGHIHCSHARARFIYWYSKSHSSLAKISTH